MFNVFYFSAASFIPQSAIIFIQAGNTSPSSSKSTIASVTSVLAKVDIWGDGFIMGRVVSLRSRFDWGFGVSGCLYRRFCIYFFWSVVQVGDLNGQIRGIRFRAWLAGDKNIGTFYKKPVLLA